MKIIVLDGYALNPGDLSWSGLEALGELTVYDRTAPEAVVERIGDASIVFTNKTLITRKIIEACPSLKFIGVLATGYNVVDTATASEKGIIVTNIPAYSTQSVAQLTLALILELCHHVGAHSDSVIRGDWTNSKDFCYWNYPLVELAGKNLGIIGYGQIGKAVIKLASAFGMKILVYSRSQGIKEEGDISFVSLEDLLANSDVVSLHSPLTAQTENLINEATLSKMKDGAFFINTSRGPLVNEGDLAKALESGKLAGAAVDVVSVEPIRADNPLLKAPNIFITPHFAWAPKDARIRLMTIAENNVKAYLAGGPINVVNR